MSCKLPLSADEIQAILDEPLTVMMTGTPPEVEVCDYNPVRQSIIEHCKKNNMPYPDKDGLDSVPRIIYMSGMGGKFKYKLESYENLVAKWVKVGKVR